MKHNIRVIVAAIAGCAAGILGTASYLHGQAARPLDGSLTHISFTVNNVDKTAKAFAALFDVPYTPAKEYRDVPWGPDFPGKVMHGKIAQVRAAGTNLEIIQTIEGESPWKDHLTKHGESVHHIGIGVPDVPAAVNLLRSKGGKQTQGFSPTVVYMDMAGAGLPITFEVTQARPAAPR